MPAGAPGGPGGHAAPNARMIPDIDTVRDYPTGPQDRICVTIEVADGGARFAEDPRAEGRRRPHRVPCARGGVRTGRDAFPICPAMRAAAIGQRRGRNAGASWRAVGVSLVFRPQSLPADHACQRAPFLCAMRDGETVAWWSAAVSTHPVPIRSTDVALAPHRAACANPSAAARRCDALSAGATVFLPRGTA